MENNKAQQLTPAEFTRNAKIMAALSALIIGVPALLAVGYLWIW